MAKPSLQTILNGNLLSLQSKDIPYIFNEKYIDIEAQIIGFSENYPGDKSQECSQYWENFIKKYSRYISAEKVMMLSLENLGRAYNALQSDNQSIRLKIQKLKQMLKGVNKNVYRVFEDDSGMPYIDVLSARKLITGEEKTENQEKLHRLNLNLLDLLLPMDISDIAYFAYDKDFTDQLMHTIYVALIKEKGIGKSIKEQLDNGTWKGTEEEAYKETEDEYNRRVTGEDVMLKCAEVLGENIEYIDFDKFVLHSAHSYLQQLDLGIDGEELRTYFIANLKKIEAYLSEKNVRIKYTLEDETGKKEISYSVENLHEDMKKLDEHGTYWGKVKVDETRNSLWTGNNTLSTLGAQVVDRLHLTKNDIKFLAVLNRDNYMFALENGMIDQEDVREINENIEAIPIECLNKLIQKGWITGEEVAQIYLGGGVENDNSTALEAEDNFFDETKEIHMDDARYWQVFWKIGRTTDDELELLSGKEWLKAYQDQKISAEFIKYLQENGLITPKDIERYKKIIQLSYSAGQYDSITQALLGYNVNALDIDEIKMIIKGMKTSTEEIIEECKKGTISGLKIAELYCDGIISEKQFEEMKQIGLISDRDEIEAGNNLKVKKVIEKARDNGYDDIDIEQFFQPESKETRKIQMNNSRSKKTKNIIHPKSRLDLLYALGSEKKPLVSRKDGLGGYQVFLITKLGIAVFEKLFRKDKEGKWQFNHGDATYVCEIGRFLQICRKSKREIRDFMNVTGNSNGNVEIITHTNQWGKKLIDAITSVNPNIHVIREKENITSILKDGEEIKTGTEDEIKRAYGTMNATIQAMQQKVTMHNLEEYK